MTVVPIPGPPLPVPIDLPGGLQPAVDVLGWKWPSSNERDLAGIGQCFLRAAREFNRQRADIHATAAELLVRNHSVGLAAFGVFNLRLAAPVGSHMAVSVASCVGLGGAYLAAAAIVVAHKIRCIAILGQVAAALAVRAAAIATGNPAVLAVLAWFERVCSWANDALRQSARVAMGVLTEALQIGAKITQSYTKVATVALQSRPADKRRAVDEHTPPAGLGFDPEAGLRAAQEEWDAHMEDRGDGRRHHAGDPPGTARNINNQLYSIATGRFVGNDPNPRPLLRAEQRPIQHRSVLGEPQSLTATDPGYAGLLEQRREKQALNKEALARRNRLFAELQDRYPDLATKTPTEIRRMKAEDLTGLGLTTADARRLSDAFQAQKVAQKELVDVSEVMGHRAAQQVMAGAGEQRIPSTPGSGAHTFDEMSVSKNAAGEVSSLNVYEAKGGASGADRLGARDTLEGRAQQGTAPYWTEVATRDRELIGYLRGNPAVMAGLEAGTVTVRYEMVEARPDGSLVRTPFVLDAGQLDLARLKETIQR